MLKTHLFTFSRVLSAIPIHLTQNRCVLVYSTRISRFLLLAIDLAQPDSKEAIIHNVLALVLVN